MNRRVSSKRLSRSASDRTGNVYWSATAILGAPPHARMGNGQRTVRTILDDIRPRQSRGEVGSARGGSLAFDLVSGLGQLGPRLREFAERLLARDLRRAVGEVGEIGRRIRRAEIVRDLA